MSNAAIDAKSSEGKARKHGPGLNIAADILSGISVGLDHATGRDRKNDNKVDK